MRQPITAGCAALCIISANQSLGLEIDDSTSALNERFANDPSFIMANYDLSGVGITDNGRWGTLVSNNVILSAAHFNPSNGSTITFYQTNDPNGASITRTVVSGEDIGTSDLWVGVLNAPVPENYAYYDIATANITNDADLDTSIYNEVNSFMIGSSPFSNFTDDQDVAVGRNVIDDWIDNVSPPGTTTDDALLTTIEGNPDQDVLYEATLVPGDSGGPLFVDLNEADSDYNLTLVGTNWFVGSLSPPPRDINGFAYTGNYDTQIQAYIDQNLVPSLLADLDTDGDTDIDDVNLLTGLGDLVAGVAATPFNSEFDLNSSGTIDEADLLQWLADAATDNGFGSAYLASDSDLDRDVDIDDLNNLLSNFDAAGINSNSFGMGDSDGDGLIDINDINALVVSFAAAGYGDEQALATLNAAPEPNSMLLLGIGGLITLGQRRKLK